MRLMLINGYKIYSWDNFRIEYSNNKCVLSSDKESFTFTGFSGLFLIPLINSLLFQGTAGVSRCEIDYTQSVKLVGDCIIINVLEYSQLISNSIRIIESEILEIVSDPLYSRKIRTSYKLKIFPGFEYSFKHPCFQEAAEGKKFTNINLSISE